MDTQQPPVAVTLSKDAKAGIPESPKDGDFVAHCPHVVSGDPVTWYWCEDTSFHKGEESSYVQWLCVCRTCETNSGNDLSQVPMAGVAIYASLPTPTLVLPRA